MKTIIGITALIILTGAVTGCHRQRADFPKSSWADAGRADPPSSLATVLLDASQANGEKILADLSPEMQQKFQRQFGKQIKAQGITLADLMAQMGSHWASGVGGFHIISQQATAADRVVLRIQPQGKNGQETFVMKKTDGEWKLDDYSQD